MVTESAAVCANASVAVTVNVWMPTPSVVPTAAPTALNPLGPVHAKLEGALLVAVSDTVAAP